MTLQKRRVRLFFLQGGRCCYCQLPMHSHDLPGNRYADLVRLLGVGFPHHMKPRQKLALTLEHLRAPGHPLRHLDSEVAAACMGCNSGRGTTPWNVHAQRQTEKHAETAKWVWRKLGDRWPQQGMNP